MLNSKENNIEHKALSLEGRLEVSQTQYRSLLMEAKPYFKAGEELLERKSITVDEDSYPVDTDVKSAFITLESGTWTLYVDVGHDDVLRIENPSMSNDGIQGTIEKVYVLDGLAMALCNVAIGIGDVKCSMGVVVVDDYELLPKKEANFSHGKVTTHSELTKIEDLRIG